MIDSVRSRKYKYSIDMPMTTNRKASSLCPVCQTRSDRLVAKKDSWSYYRCGFCPLVFSHPQPSFPELTAAYQHYLPGDPDQIQAWSRSLEEVIQKSAKLIEERRKPGRVLDVGSGYGFFLQYMAKRGWEVDGIEISQPGRDYCRTHFPGLPVRSNPLPDLSIPDNSYDAVTLFYVIEHLPDPLMALREAFRILKPGGILLLRWPHTTPIVRLLGPFSRFLDLYHTPYHLFDFSKYFIEKKLLTIGFIGIKTTISGKTKPPSSMGKVSSLIFGGAGEWLSRISQGRWLIPGVSKTTMAYKSD
jgi:2-polyprenyl-3-methyl-5-hydroxy-6-metoxy-1,4-benzoquinol methylase